MRKSFWKTNLPCWLWLVTPKLKKIRAPINHAVFTSQQDSRTWRNPDKRVQNKEHCICSSRYVPRQHTNAAMVASLFFLAHAPLTAIAPHTSPGQPHFASSEYLWMLLGVHIPLSGRLPGMGLQILSPRSCLSGIPALHPIAVCTPQCLAATSVAGVMEKNERAKNSTGAERGKRSSKEG